VWVPLLQYSDLVELEMLVGFPRTAVIRSWNAEREFRQVLVVPRMLLSALVCVIARIGVVEMLL
jgi:hypothetical protein